MGTHSVSTVLGVGTTLVGRDSELAALSGWLDEALTGSPRLVLLGGEPGIGKTRLADELSSIAPSAGVTVVWGRGTEEEGAPPFWPWRQVLARLGRDDVLDSESHAEPEVERFARFVQVTDALSSAAETDGLLVVLDDVHQIDVPSVRLLVHVAGSVTRRVLLLATHRSSPVDDRSGLASAIEELQRLPLTRRLDLGGLQRDAVAELLGLGQNDPLVVQVAERGGGNPLLVGELARHLQAGHDVSSVPPSVRDAVRNRLDARTPACARTAGDGGDRRPRVRRRAGGDGDGRTGDDGAGGDRRGRRRRTGRANRAARALPLRARTGARRRRRDAHPIGASARTPSDRRSDRAVPRDHRRQVARAGAPLEHCRSRGRPRGRGRVVRARRRSRQPQHGVGGGGDALRPRRRADGIGRRTRSARSAAARLGQGSAALRRDHRRRRAFDGGGRGGAPARASRPTRRDLSHRRRPGRGTRAVGTAARPRRGSARRARPRRPCPPGAPARANWR